MMQLRSISQASCSGCLRGHEFRSRSFPRAERGAKLSSAPPRATYATRATQPQLLLSRKELDCRRRPLARHAGQRKCRAVMERDLARKRQTEAESFRLRGDEWQRQSRRVFRTETDPVVADFDLRVWIVADADVNDAAATGMPFAHRIDRIADDVLDCTRQQLAISMHLG